MFRLFITLIFIVLIIFVPRLIPKTKTAWVKDEEGKKITSEIASPLRKYILPIRIVLGAFAFFLIVSTSYVIIDANSVGHLKRIYLGKSMAPDQIIAFPGEKGPQAEVLPPGFHFRLLLNVLYDVEERPVLEIKDLVVLDERQQVSVDGISLEVRAGEVLGLAGVQGNGQTELVEAITGLRKSLEGEIRLLDQDITGASPRQITELGTAHVPEDRQRDGLVLSFPVADNLVLNNYYLPVMPWNPTGWLPDGWLPDGWMPASASASPAIDPIFFHVRMDTPIINTVCMGQVVENATPLDDTRYATACITGNIINSVRFND